MKPCVSLKMSLQIKIFHFLVEPSVRCTKHDARPGKTNHPWSLLLIWLCRVDFSLTTSRGSGHFSSKRAIVFLFSHFVYFRLDHCSWRLAAFPCIKSISSLKSFEDAAARLVFNLRKFLYIIHHPSKHKRVKHQDSSVLWHPAGGTNIPRLS